MIRPRLALPVLALALLLTACGHRPPSTTPEPRIEVSRTRVYPSLAALAADSTAVVRVRVDPGSVTSVPADRDHPQALAATRFTAHVLTRLRGTVPDVVRVRLITSASAGSEVPPAPVAGHRYVLFLTPFAWEPGSPSGEWTVPGGAGIYRVGAAGLLQLVSRGPDALPAQVTALLGLRRLLR